MDDLHVASAALGRADLPPHRIPCVYAGHLLAGLERQVRDAVRAADNLGDHAAINVGDRAVLPRNGMYRVLRFCKLLHKLQRLLVDCPELKVLLHVKPVLRLLNLAQLFWGYLFALGSIDIRGSLISSCLNRTACHRHPADIIGVCHVAKHVWVLFEQCFKSGVDILQIFGFPLLSHGGLAHRGPWPGFWLGDDRSRDGGGEGFRP